MVAAVGEAKVLERGWDLGVNPRVKVLKHVCAIGDDISLCLPIPTCVPGSSHPRLSVSLWARSHCLTVASMRRPSEARRGSAVVTVAECDRLRDLHLVADARRELDQHGA